MFDYTGRTALVTGAGQGMGVGIAKAMASQGAKVFINDMHPERAKAAARAIGGLAEPLPGDITKAEDLTKIANAIGRLDILCNNAGVPEGMAGNMRPAQSMNDADYDRHMDLNFTAIRKLCGLFLPGMRQRKFGRILIISSESHRLGLAYGLSNYAAAKSAALGYMRCLAAEAGRDNVTVNGLSLGTMNNFEGHERAAATTLVGRAGSPEDAGAAALYLCSEEAGWMTGQTISLNGGASTA